MQLLLAVSTYTKYGHHNYGKKIASYDVNGTLREIIYMDICTNDSSGKPNVPLKLHVLLQLHRHHNILLTC